MIKYIGERWGGFPPYDYEILKLLSKGEDVMSMTLSKILSEIKDDIMDSRIMTGIRLFGVPTLIEVALILSFKIGLWEAIGLIILFPFLCFSYWGFIMILTD